MNQLEKKWLNRTNHTRDFDKVNQQARLMNGADRM